MFIFAPFSSLITLLNIINMRMEKSILDILGMSLFQTTLSDFLEGLKFRMQKSGSGEVRPVATSLSNKGLVYGTFGLVFVLGCSVSTAQRIKSSGVIDAAISQNGKVVVIDVERALDILRVSNKKWGRK